MSYREECEEIWAYEKEKDFDRVKVRMPDDIFKLFKNHMKAKQESFWVITLDGAHRVIRKHRITTGLLNRTVIHPREVFYKAVKDRAAAIVLMHNHPSGKNNPSGEDIEISRRMVEAGDIMGIKVLDHITFSKTGYYSQKENGDGPFSRWGA
jgi:DNA repair protein RadC